MGKTILHIIVALGLWFGLTYFDLHWVVKFGAIVIGAIVVHIIWERFIYNPFLYLGAIPVSSDDPVMLEAVENGKSTFVKFLEIYSDHKTDSCVRFRFETDEGAVENLWGDLLEIGEDQATVYLRTPPVNHNGELNRTMTIDRDQINDWQVEFRDGTLRGGYTNRAMFKIYEREEGLIHPKLLVHFHRFKDIDW
jgi:uncharacterized protein YegJ (DUF2314 family)